MKTWKHTCQDHTSLEFIKLNQNWYLVFCHLTSFKTVFLLLKSLMWQSLLQDSLQVVDLFQSISMRLSPDLTYYRIRRWFSCSNIKKTEIFLLGMEGRIFSDMDNSKHSLMSIIPWLNRSPHFVLYTLYTLQVEPL